MSLAALKQRLSAIVTPPRVGGAGTGAIPTGIRALDAALSDGGVPSGRLTEVVGGQGSGRTTLVREIVAGALAAQRWVAYIDGARTLAPRDWAASGSTGRLWVIRPPDAEQSAWCADVLLRSGAFGLVVLDGGAPLTRQVAIRLTRLAREHDAALVVVGVPGSSGIVGSAVRLRVTKTTRRNDGRDPRAGTEVARRPAVGGRAGILSLGREHGRGRGDGEAAVTEQVLRIMVDKGGTHRSVEVHCVIEVARRLCTHPEVPDRRGVATRGRWGERANPDVPGARRQSPTTSTLSGKRPHTRSSKRPGKRRTGR